MISSKAIKVSSSARCQEILLRLGFPQDKTVLKVFVLLQILSTDTIGFIASLSFETSPPTSRLNPAKSCLITISNPSEADLCGHFGRDRAGADPSGHLCQHTAAKNTSTNNFYGNRVSHCRCFSPKLNALSWKHFDNPVAARSHHVAIYPWGSRLRDRWRFTAHVMLSISQAEEPPQPFREQGRHEEHNPRQWLRTKGQF